MGKTETTCRILQDFSGVFTALFSANFTIGFLLLHPRAFDFLNTYNKAFCGLAVASIALGLLRGFVFNPSTKNWIVFFSLMASIFTLANMGLLTAEKIVVDFQSGTLYRFEYLKNLPSYWFGWIGAFSNLMLSVIAFTWKGNKNDKNNLDCQNVSNMCYNRNQANYAQNENVIAPVATIQVGGQGHGVRFQ